MGADTQVKMNLLVLTYHFFHKDRPHGIKKTDYSYSIRLDDLDIHCRQLQSSDLWQVDPDKIMQCHRYQDNPDRQFLITVDDGHESVEYAADSFIRHEITPIINVIAGKIGEKDYLDWSNLRSLAAKRFSIQSHAMNHIDLTGLTQADLTAELKLSKEKIEDEIGTPVTMLAVPMGRINNRVVQTACDVGYSVIMTSFTGINRRKNDLLNFKRFQIKGRRRSLPLEKYYSPLSTVRLAGDVKNISKKLLNSLRPKRRGNLNRR